MGKKSLIVIGAAVLVLAMLAAPFAQADLGAEQVEYKEAVEPICKANVEANKLILTPVRKLVNKGRLKDAARRLTRAGVALRKTHGELAAVSQPEEDKARLTKWLGKIELEATLFKKAGTKLKAGNRTAAQTIVIKLKNNAKQANNLVLGYEFRYCRFEPSKYT